MLCRVLGDGLLSFFWKEFNRLFKPPSDQQVEAIVQEDGSILTDNKDIEKEMFNTFFKGKHIDDNIDKFDSEFFDEVNDLYTNIKNDNYHHCKSTDDRFQHSSALYNPITPSEVHKALKGNKTTAESFDNCRVHPSMLKKPWSKCSLCTKQTLQSLPEKRDVDLE